MLPRMTRFRAAVLMVGAAICLLLLLGFWASLAQETRAVIRMRCTEDLDTEATARGWQTQFWQALVEERAGRADLSLVLTVNFCGAPHKSLCFTLVQAIASEPRLRVRLQQLDPRSTEMLSDICYGELDQAQSDMLTEAAPAKP